MGLTTREPSTKFYGPNYPFVSALEPSRVIIQLHNLSPGDSWDPLLEMELMAEHVLEPLIDPMRWIKLTTNFAYRWYYFLVKPPVPFGVLPQRIELTVRYRIDFSLVFTITINFMETKWMMNELLVPTDNYAFGGSCTLAWKDVKRQ